MIRCDRTRRGVPRGRRSGPRLAGGATPPTSAHDPRCERPTRWSTAIAGPRAGGTSHHQTTAAPPKRGRRYVLARRAGRVLADGRARTGRESCLASPRPGGHGGPGLPTGCVRAAERRHVGGVDLVAVDRVIADLQLLVGETKRNK